MCVCISYGTVRVYDAPYPQGIRMCVCISYGTVRVYDAPHPQGIRVYVCVFFMVLYACMMHLILKG